MHRVHLCLVRWKTSPRTYTMHNTLQETATRCNTPTHTHALSQVEDVVTNLRHACIYTATHCNTRGRSILNRRQVQHTATHCTHTNTPATTGGKLRHESTTCSVSVCSGEAFLSGEARYLQRSVAGAPFFVTRLRCVCVCVCVCFMCVFVCACMSVCMSAVHYANTCLHCIYQYVYVRVYTRAFYVEDTHHTKICPQCSFGWYKPPL